ncbi:hypothetical protein JT359_11415 [Candidatus Poribacteria bacterium]|nr:hypothetical protein [Candidatus Poribacteria bacterium]
MDPLKDIIQRCHFRHKNSLRQRKTILIPTLNYQTYPYQFRVSCAHRYTVFLSDIEEAEISIMPIGYTPQNEHGTLSLEDERFLKRQGIKDWIFRQWKSSWGINVYTGIPSNRGGANWHDLHFKYDALCEFPDSIFSCLEALVNSSANPLLTITKNGGLRFTCRVPDYLHSDTIEESLNIYRHTPTDENPHDKIEILEVLGNKQFSCWDARYEVVTGNLLDPPVIPKDIFLGPVEALRSELHYPEPSFHNRSIISKPAIPQTLGSHPLDLAKEVLVQHNFIYVRQVSGRHIWRHRSGKINDEHVLLWDQDGTVWVCASTPDLGLPTEPVSITDVWEDTFIIPPIPSTGLPITEQIQAIREAKLSPLAIKRKKKNPKISKEIGKAYSTPLENADNLCHSFNRESRIGVLITESYIDANNEIESYLQEGGLICLNVPKDPLTIDLDKLHRKQNIPSFFRWKSRMYLWNKVKDIPIHVRMENPFLHGNVCEDAERCDLLEKKGGDPTNSICPQCPVYKKCQQNGFLSQYSKQQNRIIQISSIPQVFFNPKYSDIVEEILKQENTADTLCIIAGINEYQFYVKCKLQERLIQEWSKNWEGEVLGEFGSAILNILKIRDRSHGGFVRRIQSTMQTFEPKKDQIIQQMCQVNVSGKVIKKGFCDTKTGKELATYCIEFDNDISAYIPLNKDAENMFKSKNIAYFLPASFELNVEMKFPMSMTQALRIGVFNIKTMEEIRKLPTVCRNPNWTYWHQLSHFFTNYTRYVDAPMHWNNGVLRFVVPPILHERVERLLIITSLSTKEWVQKAFQDNDIQFNHLKVAKWASENQVFQLRTDNCFRKTIFKNDNNWDIGTLSEFGLRIFTRIRSEIEKNINLRHVIITFKPILQHLYHLSERENVGLVTHFKDRRRYKEAFETADVIWLVGTPSSWIPSITWRRAQIIYGNCEKPLSYQHELESERFEDERLQKVYNQDITRLLTRIIRKIDLVRTTGKKVVLLTGFPIPNITDRPETYHFDWEDFEIADGLENLPETIIKREQFEKERDNLTADSGREKVEYVLGCSTSKANRLLRKLRGGKLLRVPFRYQIFSILSDGEKKTAEIMEGIDGHPTSVKNELKRLVDNEEILKIRRGVYKLPTD